jgi:hypothetical protein
VGSSFPPFFGGALIPAVVLDTVAVGEAADGPGGIVAAFADLIPPWLEHAPRPLLLVDPSAHVTVLAAFLAAAVAFASTPPCPEQAPLPVAVDVAPSTHTLAGA